MLTVTACPAFDSNYIWVIHNDHSAWVVDPGDADPVIAFLQSQHLLLNGILITHHHADHVGGITKLCTVYPNCPVYGPKLESIVGITHPLLGSETVKLIGLDTTAHCIAVPGHTLGHIAYSVPAPSKLSNNTNQPPYLFCGDTLFYAGCGRLFEGTPTQMYSSLQALTALPNNTLVYCAHEYTLSNLTFAQAVEPNNINIANALEYVKQLRSHNLPTIPFTLGDDKQVNPFLRCHEPSVKATVYERTLTAQMTSIDIFTHLRSWKNSF